MVASQTTASLVRSGTLARSRTRARSRMLCSPDPCAASVTDRAQRYYLPPRNLRTFATLNTLLNPLRALLTPQTLRALTSVGLRPQPDASACHTWALAPGPSFSLLYEGGSKARDGTQAGTSHRMVCATGDSPPPAQVPRRLVHAKLLLRHNLAVGTRSQVRSGQNHGTFHHAIATLGP